MSLERAAIASAPAVFVVLWSTGFIGAKYGLPYVEPLTFLSLRLIFVLAVLGLIIAVTKARWPNGAQARHSVVAGILVHGFYLAGVFVAVSQGVPAGVSALIPGLQPILVSTVAALWLGERVTRMQWFGLALGLVGVALVLHDRTILTAGTPLGWIASVISLVGISFGTLYQKRFGTGIDWRTGNLIQYASAFVLFSLGALAFETRVIQWSGDLVFALAWLVFVLSIGAVALMYWLIGRSGATQFASLFYLVPTVTALMAYALFGETLDALSIAGMVVCAIGVFIVSRAGVKAPAVERAEATPSSPTPSASA